MGTYVASREEIMARLTPAVNFLADPQGGCWEWTRPVNSWGYGQTTANGKRKAIHRLVYELFFGELPEFNGDGDSIVIDHICRNKICVNPMHLQAITHTENAVLGRLRNTHCPHGHAFEGENLRITPQGWRKCRTCERSDNQRSRDRRKAEN